MAGGGGSSGTQHVVNSTQVDPMTQKWRETVFDAGKQLYDQGYPGFYPNSTVVPFADQTQAGLEQIQNVASQPAPNLQNANAAMGRTLSGFNPASMYARNAASGGLNAAGAVRPMINQATGANPWAGMLAQSGQGPNAFYGAVGGAAAQDTTGDLSSRLGGAPDAYSGLSALTGAQQTAQGLSPFLNGATAQNAYQGQIASLGSGANPFQNGIANAANQNTTAGVGTLQQTASGAAMNPYLQSLFESASEPVRDAVNAQFAQAGRYGPNAAHTGALTRELGGLAAQIYAPAYEAERNRQLSSAGQLAGLQQADMGRQLSALGMGADVANAGSQLNLSALSTAAGLGENQANRNLEAGGLFNAAQQGDRAAALQGFGQAGGLSLQGGSLYNQALQADAARRMSGAGLAAEMYGADRAASMQGYQGAGSLFESSQGRGLQGAGLYGDLVSGDRQRQLEGSDQLGSIWSQGNLDATRAAAMLPTLYDYSMAPGRALAGVGGAYEGLAGEYLAEDQARYNYPYQAGWDHLGQFSGLMAGLPDFSQTTQTTSGRQPSGNRALGALGGAAMGAQVGSIIPGVGTAIGAGIGGLFGLFG